MKLMNNVSIDVLMQVYEQQNFDEYQLNEIRVGLERDVNVSIYANLQYHWAQMQLIRNGLERHLDVSEYLDSNMSLNDMIQIYQKLRIIKENRK